MTSPQQCGQPTRVNVKRPSAVQANEWPHLRQRNVRTLPGSQFGSFMTSKLSSARRWCVSRRVYIKPKVVYVRCFEGQCTTLIAVQTHVARHTRQLAT